MNLRRLLFLLPVIATAPAPGHPPLSEEQLAFFESRIRPVLAQECYECHRTGGKSKGGLILDHREALLRGGDSGPVLVPGDADASLLIQAIRHENDDLQMPKAGVKLDAPVIADFVAWVNQGAPDPRDAPPDAAEHEAEAGWPAVRERRMAWWSFRPVSDPPVPDGPSETTLIDRFIGAQLAAAGLEPAPRADALTLVRRLHFALTGLPPTPDEIDAFLDTGADMASWTDRLLTSPAFGERWARHWMDWIRYAESHGSEGDPRIDGAHLYRDYLIRALNADVPYNQLVWEHVCGDLLESPRINRDLALNESAIGAAHWRMVFHGFAPTDALEEKVRFTDDQINVFSQAFLGLTVSCARCHDHKFDAISQADYYALFGILASTRPGRMAADLPDHLLSRHPDLANRKSAIRRALAEDWLAALETDPVRESLHHHARTVGATSGEKPEPWEQRWTFGSDAGSWFAHGTGFDGTPSPAGEFTIAPEGNRALTGIYPAAVLSHALTEKQGARFESPDFPVSADAEAWLLVRGNHGATVRYAVRNYPRKGTVYPITELKEDGRNPGGWRWVKFDLSYWKGDTAHLELATALDAPLQITPEPRSWFAVREARLVRKGSPPPRPDAPWSLLGPGSDPVSVVRAAVIAWRDGTATDAQALLLDACRTEGILPDELDHLPTARPLIAGYREVERQVPVARRIPALAEWQGTDHPLFVRGDHRQPAALVPRRFLEAIDPEPYRSPGSGRRELAEDLLRPDNPFTARVIVNRVWHHLFGKGLVATPDNFGRLGEAPTHPELLDHLATTFVREDEWSLKLLIRRIVLTEAWQRSSSASPSLREEDPDNHWLARQNVRRLEAEAIRDSLLAVSGQLRPEPFPEPQAGSAPCRSVYVRVFRNSLDSFLAVFDAPVPFAAKGRRDVTNVPAQSLALMNDPFVRQAAHAFAARFTGELDPDHRISAMWRTALGREPEFAEIGPSLAYVESREAARMLAADRQSRLDQRIRELLAASNRITDPVQRQLEAELPTGEQTRPNLKPLAEWTFERGLEDHLGTLHGRALGTARVENGTLVLDGQGCMVTDSLSTSVTAKTLEAFIILETFGQSGGGVMTLQDRAGNVFDSLVYSERRSGEWMAGSNHFARTEDFGGPPEQEEALPAMRHLVLCYDADGTVRAYRDGSPYGRSYRKAAAVTFVPASSMVAFGLRHGTEVNPGRMWTGRILEARLYDRSLTAQEVSALAKATPLVTAAEVTAALSNSDREALEHVNLELHRAYAELAEIKKLQEEGPETAWAELAHSILNLKEFLHVP